VRQLIKFRRRVLTAIRCFSDQIRNIALVTVHQPDEEQRSDAVRSITGTDARRHRDDLTFPPGDVMYLKEGNINYVEITPIDVRSSDLPTQHQSGLGLLD
jgi:hypothetical protein